MPTVYLKGGKTVEVSLEELENYLHQNRSQLEPTKIKLGRSRIKKAIGAPPPAAIASTSDINSK